MLWMDEPAGFGGGWLDKSVLSTILSLTVLDGDSLVRVPRDDDVMIIIKRIVVCPYMSSNVRIVKSFLKCL